MLESLSSILIEVVYYRELPWEKQDKEELKRKNWAHIAYKKEEVILQSPVLLLRTCGKEGFWVQFPQAHKFSWMRGPTEPMQIYFLSSHPFATSNDYQTMDEQFDEYFAMYEVYGSDGMLSHLLDKKQTHVRLPNQLIMCRKVRWRPIRPQNPCSLEAENCSCKQSLCSMSSCPHLGCQSCLMQWIQQKSPASCPWCRAPIKNIYLLSSCALSLKASEEAKKVVKDQEKQINLTQQRVRAVLNKLEKIEPIGDDVDVQFEWYDRRRVKLEWKKQSNPKDFIITQLEVQENLRCWDIHVLGLWVTVLSKTHNMLLRWLSLSPNNSLRTSYEVPEWREAPFSEEEQLEVKNKVAMENNPFISKYLFQRHAPT
jgi:hypothetical protein